MNRLLKTLADELLEWRVALEKMRDTNTTEVDAVIAHLDDSIKSVAALRTANDIDKVAR